MIVKEFNAGWGNDIELRKFETKILSSYLKSLYRDRTRSIIVNSTWYNQDYHAKVLEFVQQNHIDTVVVSACVDPPIPNRNWFDAVDVDLRMVGYYQGPDEIDFWALIVDRYFAVPDTDMCDAENINTAFLCYNRKPHWHRKKFVDQLRQHDLLQHGVVTLGSSSGQAEINVQQKVVGSPIAPNSGHEQYGIANDIMSLGCHDIWQRCFLNVVTETVYDIDRTWFVSEKICKPIMGLRPFLVYAPNGAHQWLSHVGIDSYTRDFIDITDLDLADPASLAPFLKVLTDQGTDYWQSKYRTLEAKILHNRHVFRQYVLAIKQRITGLEQ